MSTTLTEVSAATLSCENVVIRAGRRELVSEFSWEYRPGAVAWLYGSNGSGKSSLLRVIAQLRRPTAGRVTWHGAHHGMIAYHTPAMRIPPEIEVQGFSDLVGSLSSEGAPADLIGVFRPTTVDYGDRFRRLSTGEAKRLMLWSILRRGAGPLVLDEPYEHLSRDAKQTLTELLRWIAQRAVVIVATNQDVVPVAGECVLTLNGSVVEVQHVS